MYKMIVMDFDDTLLCDDLSISQENIKAIKAAKAKGVYILFCSGRSNDSMRKYIEIMDALDDHDYFVSFNGARIDSLKGENIFLKSIPQDIVRDLVDKGHEYNLTTQFYNDGKLVVEEVTPLATKYIEHTHMNMLVMPNIKDLIYSTKVLFNSEDHNKLESLQKVIKNKYMEYVDVFFSKPNYLEVLNIEANKGLAVKFMCEHLDINKEEVIAVGDSFNDIFMIEYAGLGVSVQNGREQVKEKADYVTKATNNEDAIAEVIHKFILNEFVV